MDITENPNVTSYYSEKVKMTLVCQNMKYILKATQEQIQNLKYLIIQIYEI